MNVMIIIGSYTQTVKARNVLKKNKVNSRVERGVSQSGGCAFGLRLEGKPQDALSILKRNGIPVQKVIKNGVS